MGLDCEYPNSCSCGCQDEPVHTGCKCCGRETEHSDDCLIPENNRLRAALQKAEADARVARNETANEREMYEQMHDQVILFRRDSDKWAAEAAEQKARAERYLAAMREYITSKDTHRELRERWAGDMPRIRVEAAERHSSAAAALRAIVEEAMNER